MLQISSWKGGMKGIYVSQGFLWIILKQADIVISQRLNQNHESVFLSNQDSSQLGVLVQTVAAVVVARSEVSNNTTHQPKPLISTHTRKWKELIKPQCCCFNFFCFFALKKDKDHCFAVDWFVCPSSSSRLGRITSLYKQWNSLML